MRAFAVLIASAAALRFPLPRRVPPRDAAASSSAASELYKPNTDDPDAPLTKMQFKFALQKLDLYPSPKEMRSLWRSLDTDDDGFITMKEFERFATSSKLDSPVAAELNARLRTEPEWVLKNLAGTRASAKWDDDEIDEIEVIRMEFEAMRRAPTEMNKIYYDGSRYASTSASSEWLQVLASLKDSFVIRRVASPLKILSAWALVVALAHRSPACQAPGFAKAVGATAPLKGVGTAMTFMGSALSLLLVFRTNTAYQRYWEGRGIWERLASNARDAAEFSHVYRREVGSDRVRRIADLLCAFPLALQLHLQGQPLRSDPSADLRRVFRSVQKKAGVNPEATPWLPLDAFVRACRFDERLAALFSLPSDVDADVALNQLHALRFGRSRKAGRPVTVDELESYYNPLALRRLLPAASVASLARQRCPPLGICRLLAAEAYAIPYDEDLRWTSRERLALVSKVNALRSCVASSERIAQTPVPLHYARHTSRFLSLWTLALPLALVDPLGLFAVPATVLISWALFGLREIGTLIENPFSRPLQLQIVSDTLALDVREAVNARGV